jgi:hypothetical protein
MRYRLHLQDAWGRAEVGRFETIEQAREVYAALCQDHWCNGDGTVQSVSIVEVGASGESILASHAFPGAG